MILVLAGYGLVMGISSVDQFTWQVWITTVVLMLATLWDKSAKYSTAGLYALGLLAGALALSQLQLAADDRLWSAMMFVACYSLVVGVLWRKRNMVVGFVKQLGITPRLDSSATELPWLSVGILLSVCTIGSIAYLVNIGFLDCELRVAAALAVIAQSITLGLFAEGVWRQRWRIAAIATLAIGFVLLGWSWLTPQVDATWLNRSVILMVLVFTLISIYGMCLERCVQSIQSGRTLFGGPCRSFSLDFSLWVSVWLRKSLISWLWSHSINIASLAAIALTLVAAAVVPVWFALSPKHDPLNLQESGRMKYVYAAEIMLALLFLHVRLTMPWLFSVSLKTIGHLL